MNDVLLEDRTGTGVTVLTLNRPTRKNALDQELIANLYHALNAVAQDSGVHALVLAGAGGTFCSGADLAEMRDQDMTGAARFLAAGQALTARIADCGIPTIAAISGFALGGGFELALACDIRIAAASATIGLPEVRVGAIPAWGGTQRLTELAGQGVAMDLILTGRRLDAGEALRLGIVQRVVAAEALLEEALAIATEVGSASPAAVLQAKRLIRVATAASLKQGLALEHAAACDLWRHPDHHEGITALLEERPPRWA